MNANHAGADLAQLAGPSVDPTCAYHADCMCYKQTRHMFGFAHVGQKGNYTTALLTRDEIVDRMFVLVDDKTVDRMWIENNGQSTFMWYATDAQSRIGNWLVDFEGNTCCFTWDDRSDTIHCYTTGESFNPTDCFGQRRWASHRAAVIWTMDNIHHITTRA